jgi:hypothetical protein
VYDAILVFIILQLLDVITMKRGLELGAREGNPIARLILERMGLRGLFVLKLVGGAVVLLFTYNEWGLWGVNAFYSLIVAWNSMVLAYLSYKHGHHSL